MRATTARLPILIAAALSAAATAQDLTQTAGPVDVAAAVASTDWFYANWLDGHLWAGSRRYRTGFTAEAVEITPALGTEAPRNYPVELRLQSIRRGGTLLVAGRDVEPVLDGRRITYRRSASIVERYDALPEGLEQSFVFEQPLAGSGDLVVHFAMTTDLEPANHGQGGVLLNGPFGGVAIGAVTGIDARGERIAGRIECSAGSLDLVLPAAFVDVAVYPLVLDPLFGAQVNTGTSFDDANPDIAYDATNDTYWVVFDGPISGIDRDIWCIRHQGDGTRLTQAVAVQAGAGVATNPAIANVNSTDTFGFVWQEMVGGNWNILCRAANAGTQALTPVDTVAGTANDETDPQACGDSRATGSDDIVIVWDDHAQGVFMAREHLLFGPTQTPFETDVTNIGAGPDPFRNQPQISKSEIGGVFMTVMQWDVNFLSNQPFNFDSMQPVNAAGGFLFAEQVHNPVVAGDGNIWTVAFERREAANPAKSDIWIYGLRNNPTATSTMFIQFSARALEASANLDEVSPSIAHLGPMNVVTWSDELATGKVIHAQNLVPSTGVLCGSQQRISIAGKNLTMPVVCARRSSGANSEEAFLTFRETNAANASLLTSQRYRAFTGGPVTPLLAGCGGGGTCSVNGPAALGNQNFAITLSGADPATILSLLFVDLNAGPTINCAACTRIQSMFNFFAVSTAGNAQLGIALPCDPRYLGARLDAQWLAITPTGAPCPLFPQLNFSSAIRIVIGD